MAKQRTNELMVGVFVVIALVVVAGLLLFFGKFAEGLKGNYHITVVFPTVSGIVPDASVQYAGIPVGKVKEIKLQENGELRVAALLVIHENVVIRNDAKFTISTTGLLGDKYVDVLPGTPDSPPLKDGDVVQGMTTPDFTEAVAHVREVLGRVSVTLERLDVAVERLDRTVLSQSTLDHLSSTFANLDQASTNAIEVITGLRTLLTDEKAQISSAIANFQVASSNLNVSTIHVRSLVQDNEAEISQTFSNLSESAERLDTILAGVQRGEGTVGRLLVDSTLHDEVVKLVQNWRRYGLLYKEGKPSRTAPVPKGKPLSGAPKGQSEGAGVEFGTDYTR